MTQNIKEWIQYGSAIALITSAITLAFVSFIVVQTIGAGVLTYIGEALASAMGIFGIGVYFANQLTNFKAEIRKEINNGSSKSSSKKNSPEE